ncbi:MAG: hypothetical protein ABSH04_05290 [Acidimicrobiales bacterium]|jgi:hypothetical protein
MSFSVPPIKQPSEGSSAQPIVQYLAQVMATYNQQLTEIVPGPPYQPDQIMRALQLIESTGAQMSTYASQLEQAVPGSASQPEVATCFAYHQQTLQQAHNIYQVILRSLDLPQVVPPAGPNPLDDGPQERMRHLLEDM